MTIPNSLARAAENALRSTPSIQDPAALRTQHRPQLRRYEVNTLLPNGDVDQTRHIAPALPLFENAFCAFSRGSMIDTENGPVAIEDLWPGDRVITGEGSSQQVIWKGSTLLTPGHSDSVRRNLQLTRIMADSLGLSRPSSCLVAGPAARMLVSQTGRRGGDGESGVLTPVQSLQDGMNIIETAPPTAVEMFHLCLPRHAIIRVGGLEFESYHPGPNAARMISHAMRSVFLNLFAHADSIGDFGPMAHPWAEAMGDPDQLSA